MRVDHATLAILALLLAAEPTSSQEPSAPPPAPDLEFLEYLGSLVKEGDAWIDPTDLRGPAEAERDREDAEDECAQSTAQKPQQEQ